jgi:hypothetical protein
MGRENQLIIPGNAAKTLKITVVYIMLIILIISFTVGFKVSSSFICWDRISVFKREKVNPKEISISSSPSRYNSRFLRQKVG